MNSGNTKVISNTTPIIALSSINKLDLLQRLFGEIIIPETVVMEIEEGGLIKVPALRAIEWINIVSDIRDIKERLILGLDEGEKQTILVALEYDSEDCLVLLDERKGRRIAKKLGLEIKGTLGVLAKARRGGLIKNFKEMAFELLRNNLYYDLQLIEAISQEVDK